MSAKDNEDIKVAVKAVQDNVQLIRSAGKLAAAPQGLLINNERERSGDINLLLNYANKASDDRLEAKVVFLVELTRTSEVLNQIARLRQQYFDTRNDKIKTALVTKNEQVLITAQRLRALPSFGIYSEVDEDDLVAEAPEEIGQLAIDSIISLTSRYSKELDNTINLDQRMQDSRGSLLSSLTTLSTLLTHSSKQIDLIKADITSKVALMLLISIGLVAGTIAIFFSYKIK